MMHELIQVERQGAVQIIRINRLDKKNALTRKMYHTLTQAFCNGEADDTIRAHVIFGQPGAFSAGNDLQDFMDATASENGLSSEIIAFLHRLATITKPLLSGVDGLAIGIGTTLQFHCDLSFATPRSIFRTPFVELSLVPEAGSSLLARQNIGYQRAFALLVMGESFTAEQALQAGIIYRIISPEELEATVLTTAQTLSNLPKAALRYSRALLRCADEPLSDRIDREAEIFTKQLRSAEAAQALKSFLSRKK